MHDEGVVKYSINHTRMKERANEIINQIEYELGKEGFDYTTISNNLILNLDQLIDDLISTTAVDKHSAHLTHEVNHYIREMVVYLIETGPIRAMIESRIDSYDKKASSQKTSRDVARVYELLNNSVHLAVHKVPGTKLGSISVFTISGVVYWLILSLIIIFIVRWGISVGEYKLFINGFMGYVGLKH
ncbi:hypothetical protein NEPAR06_2089 [Nematocida parisii]|uniref:Uncharacterized protein n=1 Tax=Nematocida parisii (strain ERTm3) TaxID=935791 RepID=I3EI03_NEMP3|nr:uncharacterized protein NEPG_02447 [Nematocida parisii ERTm1]EIJ88850.1 hypothetical protein NEQG_00669 [Nematocida parisii ERTm3]KAI5146041.1 hypothetical protein NEPAR07_2057 [Nematocida parisii]EIJ92756.1 hypothetical protein NEPG_02447 [Nematocida parisii ERTm1]KAI5155968.1 hypothetical protein NEPAR06_2089 [Nematocida parisii]KAI5158625.1 hypothetical protein NEPAR05_2152 [Nematocida parisii]|eukprot:XP_013060274.1 hypothetical protein NEPG_02447 [Nematocida parisii ERTm1]